jgi:hypothetical protein
MAQAFCDFNLLLIYLRMRFRCYYLSQVFELCHIYQGFIIYLYIKTSCILVTRHEYVGLLSEIWGSHGGEYEVGCLLGRCAL